MFDTFDRIRKHLTPELRDLWKEINKLYLRYLEIGGERGSIDPEQFLYSSQAIEDFKKYTAMAALPIGPGDYSFYDWMPFHLTIGKIVNWNATFYLHHNVSHEKALNFIADELSKERASSHMQLFAGSLNTRVFNKRTLNALEQALATSDKLDIEVIFGPKIMVDESGKNPFTDIAEKYSDKINIYNAQRELPVHAAVIEKDSGEVIINYCFPHHKFHIFRSSVTVKGQAARELLLEYLGLKDKQPLAVAKSNLNQGSNVILESEAANVCEWLQEQLEPKTFRENAENDWRSKKKFQKLLRL